MSSMLSAESKPPSQLAVSERLGLFRHRERLRLCSRLLSGIEYTRRRGGIPTGRKKRVHRPKTRTQRLPKFVLPPYVPPTPEQLEKRRLLGEEATRPREEIGPLDFSLTELIREDRETR